MARAGGSLRRPFAVLEWKNLVAQFTKPSEALVPVRALAIVELVAQRQQREEFQFIHHAPPFWGGIG